MWQKTSAVVFPSSSQASPPPASGSVRPDEWHFVGVNSRVHASADHDILLTHVHCTLMYPVAEAAGGAFDTQDAFDALYLSAEEKEVLFVVNTMCPRLRAAGVQHFKSEIVRIDGIGKSAISAASCKRVKELHPEFLVMSRHSKNALTAFFLGSVAKDCIGHAPCPVMVV